MNKNISKNMTKKKKKILALVLSLATAVSVIPAVLSYADITKKTTSTSDSVTTTKEADWLTDNEGKNAQIIIESDKSDTSSNHPKILFLGTLCGAHGLDPKYNGNSTDLSTVYKSIQATAQYGDVDFKLYCVNTALTTYEGSPYTGTVDMNSSYDQVKAKLDASNATQMHQGYHSATYEFAKVLQNVTLGASTSTKTHYDYIVLEFDGMRMGHFSVTGKDLTTETNALNAASEALIPYYKQDRIAWIIPKFDTHIESANCVAYDYTNQKVQWTSTAQKSTQTDFYIYNDVFMDYDCDAAGQYRYNTRQTIKLLAPEDLVNGEVPNVKYIATNGNITEDFRNFRDRITKPSGTGIWVYYNNADEVFEFLKARLGQGRVVIEDTITKGLNIENTATDIVAEYKNSSGNWVAVPSGSVKIETSTVTAGTKVTGSFNLNSIFGTSYKTTQAHNVRLRISCKVTEQDPMNSNYLFKADTYATNSNASEAITETYLGTDYYETKNTSPELYYKAPKVTYSYTGTVPADATSLTSGAYKDTSYTGGTVVNVAPLATATGYIFTGWTTSDASVSDGKFTIADKDVAFTGSFVDGTATLTYDANGGTGGPGTQELTYSAKATISSLVPTRPGYIFKGWAKSSTATATDFTSGDTYKAANVEPKDGILYAVWEDGIDLVKSVSKTVALPGDELVYVVTVTNLTDATLTDLVAWDTVPGGLEAYTDKTSDTNITPDSGNDTAKIKKWTVGILGPGQSAAVNYTMKIPAGVASGVQYVNFAIATGFNGVTIEESKQPSSNTTTTTVDKYKTISVTKAWSDGWISHAADEVNIKLYRNGATQTDIIKLTSTNPSWSKVVPTFDDGGNEISYTFKECDLSGKVIEAGGLYGNYKVAYEVGGTLASPATTVTNIYRVKPEDLDFTKILSSATSMTPGTATSIDAKAGDTATYTISIKNTRTGINENAEDIKITDAVPEGLRVQSLNASVGTATNVGSDCTWTIASLAPQETATLEITVKVPEKVAAAKYANTAMLTELYGSELETPKPTNPATINVRSFEVSKIWKNSDGTTMTDLSKQPAVKVTLMSSVNGGTASAVGDPVELSTATNWKYKWEQLPLEDASGKAYTYTVVEAPVSGYASAAAYSRVATYGNISAVLSNTYTIKIGKTASPTNVKSGDKLTYTITLTNTSEEPIEGYKLTDTLDSNLEFESAQFNSAAGIVTIPSTGTNIDGQTLTIDGLTIPKKESGIDGKLVITVVANVREIVPFTTMTSLDPKVTINNTAKGIDGWGKEITGSSEPVTGRPALRLRYEFVGDVPAAASTPTDAKEYTILDNKATVASMSDIPGWSFDGWYDNKKCEGTKINPGSEYQVTGDTTLYGKWTYEIVTTKTADKSKVTAGEAVTYTINVKNDSANDVTDYTIEDVLEARLKASDCNLSTDADTAVVGTTSIGVEDGKDKISALGVTIHAGETVTLTITAIVDPCLTRDTAKATITNQATVIPNKDATTGKGDPATKSNIPEINPDPRSITVKYAYVMASDTDVLPDGISTPTSVTTGLKYGDLYTTVPKQSAPGWTFTGWYYRNASDTDIPLDNKGQIILDKEHVKSLATSDELVIYGSWKYDLTLEKAVSTTTNIKGGDDIQFTITARNSSPATVTNYKITDALDSRLSCKEAVLDPASAGKIATSTGLVTASNITIPAGGEVTLRITATVKNSLTTEEAEEQIVNKAKGIPDSKDKELEAEAPPVSIEPRSITVKYNYVGDYPTGENQPSKPADVSGKNYGDSFDVSATGADGSFDNDDWYTFNGWYKDEALTEKVSGNVALTTDAFAALDSETVVNLYGEWIPIDSYTVSKDVKYGDESVNGGEVLAGEPVTYSIKVKNNNEAEARSISFVDELPEGLIIVTDTDLGSGVYAGGKITWALTLGAGVEETLSFNAIVPSDIRKPTTYTNIAYVHKIGSDTNIYDGPGSKNPATETDLGPGEASFTGIPIKILNVSKTWSDGWDNHDEVEIGLYKASDSNVLNTYVCTNSNVQSEIKPAFEYDKEAEKYVELSYEFREIFGGKALAEGEVKTLNVGGKSAKYKVSYLENVDDNVYTTTVVNTYQVVIQDIDLVKFALGYDAGTVTNIQKGDEYKYKLKAKNTRSDVGVKNVVIEDEVPEGLEIGTIATDSNFDIEVDGQTVRWTIKSLDASAEAELVIPVTVTSDSDAAEFTNVANVVEVGDTTGGDPKPSNPVKTSIRNLTVSKEWYLYDKEKKTADTKLADADEQPAVTVKLMRRVDGEEPETVGTAVLASASDWSHKWTKLEMFNGENKPYIYTVAEGGAEGYTQELNYGTTGTYGNTSAVIKNIEKSVTVSYAFIAGGGPPKDVSVPASATIPYGEAYTAVPALEAEGYSFDGWFTDPAGSVKFEDGAKIKADTVLYGKWTPKKYNITYELDGGALEGVTNPSTYTPDDADITLNNPVRDGYKFVGWTGTDLASATMTVTIPHGSIGDRHYVAVWEPLNYNIRYDKPKDGPYDEKNPQFTEPTTETYPRYTKLIVDPNGGSWTHEGKTYVTPAEFILTQDINVEKPVRPGYTFLGWDRYILDEGQTVKLVARWAPDEIGTIEDEPDKSDTIPDYYQKKVIFQIKHGEWEDATIEDIVVVVNLVNEEGKLDPNGSATITIPEGMRPDEGFSPENGEWDKLPTIVVSGTEDLIYLYSYKPEYEFKPVDGADDETEKVKVEIGQKIRVNPNGGKWKHNGITHFRTVTIVIEENTVIADATRRGYKFMGWSTSIGKDGIVTLTAIWKGTAAGAKTGDFNDLNRYLFSGMFALILAALVMMMRKRGDGFGGGADGFGGDGGLKLQLESVGAMIAEGAAGLKVKLESVGAKTAKAKTAPTRPATTQMQPVQQKMAKPEPMKAVQKENKPYMGWFDSNEDYRIVEVEPVVEHKAEPKPDLPDVIEGKEFVIRIK